jgi:hypothetical protein
VLHHAGFRQRACLDQHQPHVPCRRTSQRKGHSKQRKWEDALNPRYFLSTAPLALALCAMPAAAQTASAAASQAPAAEPAEAASSAQSAQGDASEQGLKDIVVTAQRRSENLQRAAIAVSVVSSDALARLNVTQSSQLTTLVPALQVASSGSSNLFYLRGVGTFAVNSFSDPAIAFNYDGVYVGRPSATTGVFYDVERVEVLKGRRARSMAATPPVARSTSCRRARNWTAIPAISPPRSATTTRWCCKAMLTWCCLTRLRCVLPVSTASIMAI